MIAFYVLGGGLGHLTRVKTFIQNKGITSPFKIITSNPKWRLFFSEKELIYIPAYKNISPQALRDMIYDACASYSFESLYIDTFPCGILGELDITTIKHKKCFYLARRMQWQKYEALTTKVLPFEISYCFEPLSKDHQSFILSNSKGHQAFQLSYPKPQPQRAKAFALPLHHPLWLIVHSTHQEELEVLIHQAKDIAAIQKCSPHFLVLSDVRLSLASNFTLLTGENPIDWYPLAEKIFSAAGFNTWYQLSPWREKHCCIPFKRNYDDQFWRSVQ